MGDQQQFKVYRITARTVVGKIKREKVTPRVEESASISQSQRAKQNEPERRKGTNTQSTSSQSNLKKGPSRRAMSGGMQGKSRVFNLRLGSDRFSRPRPDRIYNVEDTDDEETY